MKTTSIAAVAAALVFGFGLAGCSSPADEAAERLTEELIEGAGGGEVEVDIDDESITFSDEQGNEFSAGDGSTIPDTWPEGVPLYMGGQLVFATVQAEGTASALWETDESVEAAVASYDDALQAAGYSLDQEASMAGAQMRTYSGNNLMVNVTVAEGDGVTDVTIAVMPQP